MGTKLYVGNISPDADKTRQEALFSVFGTVERAYIITDRQTGRSKGFGFVVMSSDADAQAAIAALDGKDCNGYTVKVNEAKAQGQPDLLYKLAVLSGMSGNAVCKSN